MKSSKPIPHAIHGHPDTSSTGHNQLDTDISDHEPEGDSGHRTIYLCEPVTPAVTIRVTTELLQYETAAPGEPIHMFIYSPGGCVISGLAIIDIMQHITSPVFTYAIGFAASMGAVILACGQKEYRYILPHSRVMIHQASGSAGGTLDNVRATLAFQSALEGETEELLAAATGRTGGEIRSASRVDNWMNAKSARDFGLVDHILTNATTKTKI
jgi:ATP-dependent Clp protease, protease subunit